MLGEDGPAPLERNAVPLVLREVADLGDDAQGKECKQEIRLALPLATLFVLSRATHLGRHGGTSADRTDWVRPSPDQSMGPPLGRTLDRKRGPTMRRVSRWRQSRCRGRSGRCRPGGTVAVGRFERTECNHGGDSCGRGPDPFEETGKDLAGGKRSLRLEPYHPSRAARKNLHRPNRLSQVLPGSKYGPPLGRDPRSEAGAHPGADPQMQTKSPPRTTHLGRHRGISAGRTD